VVTEGVVGEAAVDRLADDDMVNETDLHEVCGGDDAFCEVFVLLARAGISRGVVVDEDEAVGLVLDDGAEDIARMAGGVVDGALGDAEGAGVVEAGVCKHDVEALRGLATELGDHGLVDALCGVDELADD